MTVNIYVCRLENSTYCSTTSLQTNGQRCYCAQIVLLYLVSTYVGSNFNTYYLFSIVYLTDNEHNVIFLYM
jgi:hypothetical protein